MTTPTPDDIYRLQDGSFDDDGDDAAEDLTNPPGFADYESIADDEAGGRANDGLDDPDFPGLDRNYGDKSAPGLITVGGSNVDNASGTHYSETQKEILSGHMPGFSRLLDKYYSDNDKAQSIVSNLLQFGDIYLSSPLFQRKKKVDDALERMNKAQSKVAKRKADVSCDFENPDTWHIFDIAPRWLLASQTAEALTDKCETFGYQQLTYAEKQEYLVAVAVKEACDEAAAKMDAASFEWYQAACAYHSASAEVSRWQRDYPNAPDYGELLQELEKKEPNFYKVEPLQPWPIIRAELFAKQNKTTGNPSDLHDEKIWAGVAEGKDGNLFGAGPRNNSRRAPTSGGGNNSAADWQE